MKRRIHPASVWIPVIIILLGIVVYANWLMYMQKMAQQVDRLPEMQALEKNFSATNQDGEEVSLGDLQGKVWLVSYVFTRCPMGCAPMTDQMVDIQKQFADNNNFHLVSISIDPEHDQPDQLKAFASQRGADLGNWWFLTGDREEVHSYMNRYFKFGAKKETDPEIAKLVPYQHQPMVALIDQRGMIRNKYDLLDARNSDLVKEQLEDDIQALLVSGWRQDDLKSYHEKQDYFEDRVARLPKIRQVVENFTAENMDGNQVALTELKGKVWIAATVFTRCPMGCAPLTQKMAELQERMKAFEGVQFVSFSLDPKFDSPDKLREFAEHNGAKSGNWWFLTHDQGDVRTFLKDNFFYEVKENTDPKEIEKLGLYTHDTRLALVDQNGNFRKTYDVLTPGNAEISMENLIDDVEALIQTEKSETAEP